MNKMISDRYMVVTSLGEGGMADVYLAIDTILNREVAIKVLRGELSNDPVTLLRFQREANAASKLNHPNVVDVYDVGECEGRHYIVMEYVRGRTLKQLISQRGALDKKEAVDIMIQLTSAVQHAHENNIIHRDIKPQNVLVKDDGTVKITDFGIALAHDAVQLTQSDAVLGSAHYLAPETTRGEPATNQIDIYALGIVFYELLSGSVPYKGENPVQIAMKHLREEMPRIKEFNPTLPQSVENIITKATVKNRKLRYQSAADMLRDLKLCLLPEYEHVPKLQFEESNPHPTVVMDEVKKRNVSTGRVNPTTRNTGQNRKLEVEEALEEVEAPSTKNKKIWIGVVISLIIALVLIVIVYFSGLFPSFAYDPAITIPNIMDLTKEEAKAKLLDAGFKETSITFVEAISEDGEDGEVFACTPNVGEKAKKSDGVTVKISKGNYMSVENYVGKNIEEVKKMIQTALPKAEISVKTEPNAEKEPGTILQQSGVEIGAQLSPEKAVTIYFTVASAPKITIPDLIGTNIDEAYDTLDAQGVVAIRVQLPTVGMSEEELAQIEKGVVVRIDPEVGTVYVQDGVDNTIKLYYY